MAINLFSNLKQYSRRTRPAWRKTARLLRRFRGAQPLTLRGLLALVLSASALQFFAAEESDLIAYMLGGGVAALVLVSLIGAIVTRRKLAAALQIEPHFDRDELFSRSPVRAGLTVRGAVLPPFYSLHIQREFEHRPTTNPEHIVSGREEVRRLVDTLRFPHRGFWALDHLSVSLRDALGFTEISWEVASNVGIEVSARNIHIRSLPIVAASSRSGDMLDQAQERAGDLFDIKQYDPSDGVKRILWKVYAKTGAVVVRRPEPAIIPEGEVAVYLVAGRSEDHVAGALQSYLDELEKNSITILFGTDGAAGYRGSWLTSSAGEPASGAQDVVASDLRLIRSMINRSVWSPSAGSGRELEQFLAALRGKNRVIRRLVVFASESSSGWYEAVSNTAAAHHAALTVVLAPDSLDPEVDLKRRLAAGKVNGSNLLEKARRKFLDESPAKRGAAAALSAKIGTQSGTELLICERAA